VKKGIPNADVCCKRIVQSVVLCYGDSLSDRQSHSLIMSKWLNIGLL